MRWQARVAAEIERAGESAHRCDRTSRPPSCARSSTCRPTSRQREIGERLYITRNTVKTHTVAIYRKLDVTSRSGAVVRGRELGLIE